MSNSATPKLKQFARRLLAYEAASRKPAASEHSAAFHVFEKLRGPFGKLLGAGGFRVLLTRALILAGAETPWLRELQIKADGSVEGLDAQEGKLKARAVADGEVVLVAQLVSLMVTFLGKDLTMRLLQDIWPQMENVTF